MAIGEPGFGVRLTPKGKRSFLYRYKTLAGKRQYIGLGVYPGTSLKKARAKYVTQRAIRHDPVERADPKERIRAREAAARKEQHAAAYTVMAMAEEFLKVRSHKLAPGTLTGYSSTLRANILPALGDKPAADVTLGDIARTCERVAARGKPAAAAVTRRLCRALFAWARGAGRIAHNPATELGCIGNVNEGERVLSADELRRFLAEAPSVLGPESAAILELQLLTGCRIGEIAGLLPGELDREARELIVPAARIKTRRALSVPLSNRALPLLPDQGWPGNASKRTQKRLRRALRREWADMPRFTAHDMRRTARTTLGDLGCSYEVGELILGHALPGVVAVYNKSEHRAERREWLERLAAYYDGLRAGKVVKLRAG